MKLKDIRALEWAIGIGIFLVLVNYVFWGYHIERYEKFIRAGAANSIIWRALNAKALGITGSLAGISDLKLGIPANPERCKKPLGQVEFPSRCRIFDKNNGGKAVNCGYWWLGRNCRIVYMSEDVFRNRELKSRIFHSFEKPCAILANPGRVRMDTPAAERIAADFRSGFGCDARVSLWPVETLIILRKNDTNEQIKRVVKR